MARPRRAEPAGAGLGALIGAALSGGAGALIGGILGAAATQQALDKAIEELLTARGLQLVNLYREAPNQLTVLFSSGPSQYWSVTAHGRVSPTSSPDVLDDALFDAVLLELETWGHEHARV